MMTKLNLKYLTALFCAAFTAEVRAQLPNAWQITDNSTAGGSAINYTTNLPADLCWGFRD